MTAAMRPELRLLLSLLCAWHVQHVRGKILRNNALMNKMVSHFQGKGENAVSIEKPASTDGGVVTIMQNVLCRNFPTIPCNIITQDNTLRHLIEKSIQQLNYKKQALKRQEEHTTTIHSTSYPIVNSEDLSNFLQVVDNDYYGKRRDARAKPKNIKTKENEAPKNKSNAIKRTVYGRKKLRKFYPHKVKYKDKYAPRKDFPDYTEEKNQISVSVEVPDVVGRKNRKFDDPPVWRIDYMKHGEPSFNAFGYEADSLKGKIIKSGRNGMVDETVTKSRKEVLHPDVYIKKNFVRQNSVNLNSEGD